MNDIGCERGGHGDEEKHDQAIMRTAAFGDRHDRQPCHAGLGGYPCATDFRSDNRAAFRAVFRQFTLLCRELNLFGRELLAVDGTRIKAVNNKDRNFTMNSLAKFIKAVDKRLDEFATRDSPRTRRRSKKQTRRPSHRDARRPKSEKQPVDQRFQRIYGTPIRRADGD
jgi:hypothetical protein